MQGTLVKQPWRQVLVLALVNALLFFLLYPRTSYFIEDVLSSYLPYARADPWPGMGTVTHLYFRLVYPLFGEAALPYHLVTWLLHLLNALLLYLFTARLAACRTVGLMAALVWSCHPGISAVSFITKRVDTLLAVASCLAGLLLVLRWLEQRGRSRHLMGAAPVALFSLVCQPTVLGLWLLAPALCLFSRGRAVPPLSRWLQAARVTATLMTLPLILVGGMLLWSRASQGASVGSVTVLGDALACLAGSWWERVLGVGVLIHSSVAPFPLTSATVAGAEPALLTGQVLPAGLLLGQVGLALCLRSRFARLALLWLLLAALPLLLQTTPCPGFGIKEKYLYMILPGACLLWGYVLTEGGRRLAGVLPSPWRGRGRQLSVALCLVLCAALLVGLQRRARARDTAGRVVRQGVRHLRAGLAMPSTAEKLVYSFLSNEVHRYQTFTGGGDMVHQALAGLPGAPAPNHFTIEHPAYLGQRGWNLYRHLGLTPAPDPAETPATALARFKGLMESRLPLPPGLDGSLPVSWSRQVLAHYTHPEHGVQDITATVLPSTRVMLSVRLAPGVKGPLLLGGDLGAVASSPMKVQGGVAAATLLLTPGLYRFCLVDAGGGGSYVFRGDSPELYPVRHGFTLLPVVNRALPLGLEGRRGSAAYGRVAALKAEIMLAPRDPRARSSLLRLYEQMGLQQAAQDELELLRRLEKEGGLP